MNLSDLKILIKKWRKTAAVTENGKDVQSDENETKEEKPDSIGQVSMTDGDHGTIFGINRKIVAAITIFFIATFGIAFILSLDEKKPKNKELYPVNQNQEIVSNAARRAENSTELPNTYAALAAMDQQPKQKRKMEEQTSTSPNEKQIQQNTTRNVTPAHPYTYTQQPSILPAIQQSALAQQTQRENERKDAAKREEAKKLEEQYRSAIAFTISSNTKTKAETAGQEQSVNTAAQGIYEKATERTLLAGSVIPVMLLTGINTDAAGQVSAQVQADIYDSLFGRHLLIPAGSRVIGACSGSNNGRITVTFDSLILPDGGTYKIKDSLAALDGAAYNGIKGKVEHHTERILSSGMLGSAIAALGSIAAGNTSSSDTYTAGQLASQGAMSNLINTTSKMLEKNTNIADTVTVEPGYTFSLYVTQNISF